VADWTIEAMKFLSCVARCKERFGMSHIIDVLRGSKNQKVRQYGHHNLSTYGIGKDKSVEDWRMLGRSLLHQGLVAQTTDGYSVLKLNAHSWEVMRRQRSVSIAVTTAPTPELSERENARAAEVEMLFGRLRSLRKQLADEQGLAPYMVFSDSSLKLMATVQPQTLAEFSKISGVGSHKLTQYGGRFVAEIQAYCQEQGLPAQADVSTPIRAVPSYTQSLTLDLHQQGLTVAEIAQKRGFSPNTILNHLAELIEMNQPVDLTQMVPPERQLAIMQAIQALGAQGLKSIYEYLKERYTYDEIKLVRAWWRRENNG
jgi:ATP-dependent DNA helicase RecQ